MKCFRCELNANGRSMRMAGEDPEKIEKIGEDRTKKQFEYDKNELKKCGRCSMELYGNLA